MFEINLRGMKLADDVNIDTLIQKAKGYSGADISNVCRDAAMMPLRNAIANGTLSITEIADKKPEELDAPITHDNLLEALRNIQKSVSNEMLQEY